MAVRKSCGMVEDEITEQMAVVKEIEFQKRRPIKEHALRGLTVLNLFKLFW